MSDWLREIYYIVDALDAERYAKYFEEDGTFTLGNNPTLRGPAQIAAVLNQFHSTIAGMHHDFIRSWEVGGTEIAECTVTYTRKDGAQLTLPAMVVYVRSGDRIRESRSYIDISPLHA
jgi:limonene-1,2-epoxide hydrolase